MLILIDLDGVLASWKDAAHAIHGKVFDEAAWPKGQYECHEVLGSP